MPPRRETRLHAFAPPDAAAAAAPEASAEPDARSVSEVVAGVNRALAPGFTNVGVRGEISGFKRHSSGHWYFSLKDSAAILSAAMFAGANGRLRFLPEEGMEVLARGRVTVYGARGQLQLVVDDMRPVGAGALQLAFDQLKRRLAAEGLFDAARKRALPEYPRGVGIVTSLQAAALRDVVRVATTRNPAVRLLVADARVQGEGAAAEIEAAIARLNADGRCDVIIMGRGGGSIEDLWAFNEERVVRAIVASRIPIVSAVGHETDFTLADFAADARAPTPSAAAEMVVPDAEAIEQYLDDAEERMQATLARIVPDARQRVDELSGRAEGAVRLRIGRERELLAANAARLDALSPLAVLARGYSVTQHAGNVVRSVDDVATNDAVDIILKDGRIAARVQSTKKEEPRHGETSR